MYRTITIVLLIFIGIAPLSATLAQTPSDQQLQQAIQTLLDEAVANSNHGVVLWIDTPEWTFRGASGWADVEAERTLIPDDVFRAASITKMFTATVILQLAEEGRLSLDDRLKQWLPVMAAHLPYGNAITVRHLLNHTSGVYNFTDYPLILDLERTDFERMWTPEAVAQLVFDKRDFPIYPPGERWRYSNTGYILLGMIIETASGQSLAANYRHRIFEPLAMRQTYLADVEPVIATPVPSTSYFLDASRFNASMIWSAGGAVSTAPDLLRFARALFDGELFHDPATLDAMLDFSPARYDHDYGLGVYRWQTPYGIAWGHAGTLAGFTVWLRYFPERDTVIVEWYNTEMPKTINMRHLYDLLNLE